MPSNDQRFYLRIFPQVATTTTCPQALLDQFKLIKTPATEEADAVYYVEADGLTIHEAATMAGVPCAFMAEPESGKPEQVQTMEEANMLLYVLPPLLPTALEPIFSMARQLGVNPNKTLLYANYSYEPWLATGQLPN